MWWTHYGARGINLDINTHITFHVLLKHQGSQGKCSHHHTNTDSLSIAGRACSRGLAGAATGRRGRGSSRRRGLGSRRGCRRTRQDLGDIHSGVSSTGTTLVSFRCNSGPDGSECGVGSAGFKTSRNHTELRAQAGVGVATGRHGWGLISSAGGGSGLCLS
jgi:hypothetical protein